jgi:hypothetical protein
MKHTILKLTLVYQLLRLLVNTEAAQVLSLELTFISRFNLFRVRIVSKSFPIFWKTFFKNTVLIDYFFADMSPFESSITMKHAIFELTLIDYSLCWPLKHTFYKLLVSKVPFELPDPFLLHSIKPVPWAILHNHPWFPLKLCPPHFAGIVYLPLFFYLNCLLF